MPRGISSCRSFSLRRSLRALSGAILLAAGAATGAAAQDALPVGGAVVTGFSGTVERTDAGGTTRTVIDLDGVTGRALDLGDPGRAPDGTPWQFPPELFRTTARQTGQVFGVALDGAAAPNVYLTATSAFGLHRTADNGDWMEGMWGPDGGPGSIWKLSAANGYAPEFFARITLDGRLNTGAGLGNIAYDPVHLQFYVSDLETGMIHRLSLSDGRDLGRYDHGAVGRAAFTDAATGAETALAPIPFDPASAARVTDCPSGDFRRDPSCWNFADFRRRVWGLDVRHERPGGEIRLYYAVWSSQGFGHPDFAAAPEDERRNSVWSVRIAEDGSFDTASVRREFAVPDFFRAPAEIARAGFSNPVTDIAFPKLGSEAVMLLAERGGVRNLGLGSEDAFAAPQEARVLRYRRDADGVWRPDGRFDVGYQDRQAEGTPHIRAGAAGGVAFGMGYDAGGALDTAAGDRMVWMTGDALCAPAGPCPDGTGADGAALHGLQGSAADSAAEVEPAAAFAPYPPAGPATPPAGPDASFMVDAGLGTAPGRDASWTGDIAFHQSAPAIARIADLLPWGPPGEIDEGDRPPADTLAPDLAVSKLGPDVCDWERECDFLITVTNNGPGVWEGPILLYDALIVPIAGALPRHSSSWTCFPADMGFIHCEHPDVTLAPGETVMLALGFAFPAGPDPLPEDDIPLENCALLNWPISAWLSPGPHGRIYIIELGLMRAGYFAGPPDGDEDPALLAAIAAYRAAEGLPDGGIDDALFDALYPGMPGGAGDADSTNDIACWPFVLPGEDHVPPPAAARDLAIAKDLFTPCVRDEEGDMHIGAPGCRFMMRISNVGTEAFEGPLSWLDSASVSGPGGGAVPPDNIWAMVVGGFMTCDPAGGTAARCSWTGDGPLALDPGDAFGGYEVFVRLPATAGLDMENCVIIDWDEMGLAGWDGDPSNDWVCITVPIPLEGFAIDLGVGSETSCLRGESCSFEAWIENTSDETFEGAIGFEGALDPALPITAVEGLAPGLICSATGAADYQCLGARLSLAPQSRARARITVDVPADFGPDTVAHSKALIWVDDDLRDDNEKNDRHVSQIEILDPEPEEVAPPPPPAGAPDLALSKVANQGSCTAGTPCAFSLNLSNAGDAPYDGPVTIRDTGTPFALRLVSHAPGGWACTTAGAGVTCTLADLSLAPGASTALSLRLATNTRASGRLTNCAAIDWVGPVSVREVQEALNEAGFDAGFADGIAGPRTRAAIRGYQAANGLPDTGEIDAALVARLLGRSVSDDGTPENDRDCAEVTILAAPQPEVTPPPEQPDVTPPPPQQTDDDVTPPQGPVCPSGFQQVGAAQAAIFGAQGREVRSVSAAGRTILCVGPPRQPPALQCPSGFQQVTRTQAKDLVQQGYEIRQVREGQASILCARPGQQQPPAQVVPRVVPELRLIIPQVTPGGN